MSVITNKNNNKKIISIYYCYITFNVYATLILFFYTLFCSCDENYNLLITLLHLLIVLLKNLNITYYLIN